MRDSSCDQWRPQRSISVLTLSVHWMTQSRVLDVDSSCNAIYLPHHTFRCSTAVAVIWWNCFLFYALRVLASYCTQWPGTFSPFVSSAFLGSHTRTRNGIYDSCHTWESDLVPMGWDRVLDVEKARRWRRCGESVPPSLREWSMEVSF